ncbi:MAG TPA: ubiquitin-like small modifier protein 1 [Symbiobacteriaceae bacterium]|jgi:molybdopterin synthase sulfur carrier subunit
MLVKLFASFRLPGIGHRVEVDLPAEKVTVAAALEALFGKHPELRGHIMTEDGAELQPFVQVMLQGRLIRDLAGLMTPVTQADTLAIFPPSAGG